MQQVQFVASSPARQSVEVFALVLLASERRPSNGGRPGVQINHRQIKYGVLLLNSSYMCGAEQQWNSC